MPGLRSIQTLRRRTGASVTESRFALEQAAGDVDDAVELLQRRAEPPNKRAAALWSHPYEKPHRPLTQRLVAEIEARLGVTLPSGYVSLLSSQNGGYLQRFSIPAPGLQDGAVVMDELFGIASEEKAPNNILFSPKEWGLPTGVIPLSGDGHVFIALDYRQVRVNPFIVYIDAECGGEYQLAPDFDRLVESLMSHVTFTEHLRRYQTWLRGLDDAPSWSRVLFVNSAELNTALAPIDVRRDQLLLPEQFEGVFERYMDGRYAWINLECLGTIDDTLFLTHCVSSGGPADQPHVPRDRITINFSGPDTGSKWDATAWIRIV